MSGYGTIRKQIAKLTGEIPELAELDHFVNDLRASVKPAATEVVRTVKVADDAVVQEVKALRQTRIELEESLDQERKSYKGLHAKYLDYLRSLSFGLIVAETVLPNYVRTFMSSPEVRHFILKPETRFILVDRQGEDHPDGFCCHTYLCETVADLMKQIKDCPEYILIFACGGGTVTQYCVTTTSECAAELTSLVENAAKIMMGKLRRETNRVSPPIPLSLLICDHVWRDMRSGKHHILGTFSGLGSSVFPVVTDLTIYFALTEGQGRLAVRLELIDVDEERPVVVDAERVFEARHLREVIEGTFAFNSVVFPEPGEYRLKLFVGGEFLMERALHLTPPQNV